tara:strand:- start:9239 stop:9613 length:375 start_codon:yes stop_codon:yes gene_type:complete
MCKFLKPCLYIAGGIVGIITSIKLIIWWDRSGDLPPVSPTRDKVKDDESDINSSSSEEIVIVEGDLSSRSGHTIKSTFERKVMKLSHMKKQDLIDECMRRNIACVGTVRVLRERLRIAREEEQA